MKYSVYYINTSEIPNQLSFKSAIYYVTITTVISSRGKITCYLHVWRYELFAGRLTWYFTGVYVVNKFPKFFVHVQVCTQLQKLQFFAEVVNAENHRAIFAEIIKFAKKRKNLKLMVTRQILITTHVFCHICKNWQFCNKSQTENR